MPCAHNGYDYLLIIVTAVCSAAGLEICSLAALPFRPSCSALVFFLGEITVEETYDRMFTVTSRVRFYVTKEDDGVPVDCIIDHPAAKDLLAQRSLEVLCE